MRNLLALTVVTALALPAAARAEEEPVAEVHPREAHAGKEHLHGPCTEPDFDFLSTSPYTERAWTPKVVLATQLAFDGHVHEEGKESVRDLATTLRLELGITDDLEFGAAVGYGLDAVKLGGEPFEIESGALDTTIEFRYRLLDEEESLLSLTVGPLLLIPTGDHETGFSLGRVGWGLEASAGRDFGRFFVGGWIQRVWTYDVLTEEDRGLDVHTLQYSLTVLGKLLERREAGGTISHVHGYLEFAGGHNNKIAPAAFTADQTRGRGIDAYALAPGISYGIESPEEREIEFGVSFPIGLNSDTDELAVIFQAEASF